MPIGTGCNDYNIFFDLILDEDRFNEYDAWERLVKVSLRGTLPRNTPL